jgi:hypothetical protein
MHAFFVLTMFWQLFSSYMYVVKAAKMTIIRKISTFNVDEIDTCSQLHQHFMQAFFVQNRNEQLFSINAWLCNFCQ